MAVLQFFGHTLFLLLMTRQLFYSPIRDKQKKQMRLAANAWA